MTTDLTTSLTTAEVTVTWREAALATGPADRAAAEDGVRRAYRDAGLSEPEHILWFDSPAAGAVAAAALSGGPEARAAITAAGLDRAADQVLAQVGTAPAGRSVRDSVRTGPWERARRAVHEALGPAGWSGAWASSGGELWPPVNRLVLEIRRAIAETDELLRRVTLDAVLGQHDAAWLCVFAPDAGVVREILSGVAETERSALGALCQVARAAGWWWPFERVALLCERPVELHLDDLGRLHRADGPAMLFADGFALQAWHGMPVPADFGATMATLDAGRIRSESNAELRRVMLEHFGYDRYLADSGASPIHADETGVLWRIALPDDEDVLMVEVVNSTPEPDGTRRTYFLRVPPWVVRARQGVAWTFGVTEEEYRPERET